jgi:hypothetical protein
MPDSSATKLTKLAVLCCETLGNFWNIGDKIGTKVYGIRRASLAGCVRRNAWRRLWSFCSTRGVAVIEQKPTALGLSGYALWKVQAGCG